MRLSPAADEKLRRAFLRDNPSIFSAAFASQSLPQGEDILTFV